MRKKRSNLTNENAKELKLLNIVTILGWYVVALIGIKIILEILKN